MAGLLSSIINPTIDPVQLSIRSSGSFAPASTSSTPSSSDDFESVLAQAQKPDDTEQPGPPASDKATQSADTDQTSKKKSRSKSTARRKKADQSKSADGADGKPAKPVKSADAKKAAAADKPDADGGDADAEEASKAIAAQTPAAQPKNGAILTPAAQFAAQPALNNSPPAPTPKTATAQLPPIFNSAVAQPASAKTVAADPSTPDTSSAASDTAEATELSNDATEATEATSAKSTQSLPAPSTGLKSTATTAKTTTAATSTAVDSSAALSTLSTFDDADPSDDDGAAAPLPATATTPNLSTLAAAIQSSLDPKAAAGSTPTSGNSVAGPPAPTRSTFVASNQPSIVKAVKSELLPTGGTMHLRLDPPELGVLQVSVHVKDGVVNASFQTSNDDATKLLSRSLGELKTALEAQGVSIGKMHVQQTPKEQATANNDSKGNSDASKQSSEGSSSRQDEQRRETLKRMWERLANGGDPLDLVA